MAGQGWKKNNPGCKCCCPSKIQVCVTKCGGANVSGASITVTGAGGPYSCTTDGSGCCTINVGLNTGNFTVSYTSGGFSGSQTVHVPTAGCQTVNANFFFAEKMCNHVFGCSGPISGVSISGGGTSCTTDASGNCCLNFTSNQTFPLSLTATLPSGPVRTVSTDIGNCTCSVHNGPPFGNCWQFIDKLCASVIGCNGKPVSGATVTWSNGSTCTTSGAGTCCATPTSDISLTANLTMTVTDSSCNLASVSVTGPGQNFCNQVVTMPPASGYQCCPGCACATKSCYSVSDANGGFTLCLALNGVYSWHCYSAPSTNVFQTSTTGPCAHSNACCCQTCGSGNTKVAYNMACGLDAYGSPQGVLNIFFECLNCMAIAPTCVPCSTPYGNCTVCDSCASGNATACAWQYVFPLSCTGTTFSATPPASAPCYVGCQPGTCPAPVNCTMPTLGTVTGS